MAFFHFSIEGVLQCWAVGKREDDTHMYVITSEEVSFPTVLKSSFDLRFIDFFLDGDASFGNRK